MQYRLKKAEIILNYFHSLLRQVRCIYSFDRKNPVRYTITVNGARRENCRIMPKALVVVVLRLIVGQII